MNEEPVDLRPVLVAGCAWLAALTGVVLPPSAAWWIAGGALVGWLVLRRRLPAAVSRTAFALVLLWMAVVIGTTLRDWVVRDSFVAAMAKEDAVGRVVVEIRGDPTIRPGVEADRATVQAIVVSLEARGRTSTAHVRVFVVLAASDAGALQFGARFGFQAKLAPSTFPGTAAVLAASDRPVRVRGPSSIDSAAAYVRDGIQRATLDQNSAAGLVPALVDGDERTLPPNAKNDFEAAGLLHLLAVSGTNFVLLGSAGLAIARRLGVRRHGLVAVGLVLIAGLVVLARAEPSVIRAAVMGAVALIGLSNGRPGQAGRALCFCIALVMLFVPSLAVSPGFALSAMATGGILLFASRWRDAMTPWLPRFLAEGIAVCLAAYVACLPLLIALSGRVSLVAIPANLAAGAAVAPTTILGFAGGVVGLFLPEVGRVVAALATWGASWIVQVAHVAAGVRQPEVAIASRGTAIVAVLCVVLALVMGWLLRRPLWALPVLLGSVVLSTLPVPTGSWPPSGWVAIACDVGQGDGLVVRLADQRALVIDTGPDPERMRTCLRDLRIKQVPLLLLTHFHADHVNGLSAVLATTKVGAIEVTDFEEPAARAASVRKLAATAKVPIRTVVLGEQTSDGDASWRAMAPIEPPSPTSDSPPNDSSVVLLLQIRGIRILFTGDEETTSQGVFNAAYPGLKADVLKVAHHGSAKQDSDLIASVGARDAIISVGRGNKYGLPKASTIDLLHRAGMAVHRTDTDGAVAVVVDSRGEFRVVSQR